MITDRLQKKNNELTMSVHTKDSGRLIYVSILGLFACLTITTTVVAAQNETRGDGRFSAPVIPGDRAALPVSSGVPDNSAESSFAQTTRQTTPIIYLRSNTYSHNTHEFRGIHTVSTINLETIHNPMKLDLIASILQLDLSSIQKQSQSAIWIDVNETQLEQIQNILAPSANDLSSIVNYDPNGRKHIFQDPAVSNLAAHEPWLLSHLPIVKQFSRYAVLLGIVMATVLFSLAGYGLTMGERGSGQRIIGTAAGLIILLMAFSIYRLLISNSINNSASDTVQFTQ